MKLGKKDKANFIDDCTRFKKQEELKNLIKERLGSDE